MCDCANECEPLILPNGIDGQNGAPGAPGANGFNAYTRLATSFVQPAANTDVTIEVDNAEVLQEAQYLFIESGGYYIVTSITATGATIRYNSALAISKIADVGEIVGSDKLVTLSGPIGPQGLQGIQGEVGDQGEVGETGPQGNQGVDGNSGWSPVLVPVKNDGFIEITTGLKTALKIIDYVGGEGTAPSLPVNPYLNSTGFGVLANATDISGSVWYSNGSAPNPALGKVGDFYLDTISPNTFYTKTAISTWTSLGNLKGATGATGATGAAGANGAKGDDGTTLHLFDSDISSPYTTLINDSIGNEGDLGLSTESNNLYNKTASGWSKRTVGTFKTMSFSLLSSPTAIAVNIGTYSNSGASTSVVLNSVSGTISYKVINDMFVAKFRLQANVTNGEAQNRKLFLAFRLPQEYLTSTTDSPVTRRRILNPSGCDNTFSIMIASGTTTDTVTSTVHSLYGTTLSSSLGTCSPIATSFSTNGDDLVYLPISTVNHGVTDDYVISGQFISTISEV